VKEATSDSINMTTQTIFQLSLSLTDRRAHRFCIEVPVKAGSFAVCKHGGALLPSFPDNLFVYSTGTDSSVGIATDYGLDGPGLNPGRDEIFRPSTPALGPTQPPVKWVLGLSRG